MNIKHGVDFSHYRKLDPKLKMLVAFAELFITEHMEKTFVVTELWRPAKHDQDLHPLYRAVDARLRLFSKSEIDKISKKINLHFIYDPQRLEKKACVVEPDHFHFQVHPRTVVMFPLF